MRAGNSPPRMAPRSRIWRTSARVSRSVIAGMPQSVSQVSQPPSAPAGSSRSTPARMIAARAWMRSDSIAASADAVVADLGKGEGDQLSGVAGITHRLLIARHRGGEDDLSHGVIVGPTGEPVKARAVLEQHVGGGRRAHRLLSVARASVSTAARWATAPAAIVSSTRPCSVRPWKQRVHRAAGVAARADLPARVEVDQAQVGGLAHGDPRRGQVIQRRRRRSSARPRSRARARRSSTSSV